MKRCLPCAQILLVFVYAFLFAGCFKDNISKEYTILSPVYATKASVLENIKSNAPRELGSPGKIFIQGRYIFVNEIDEGIHIIDNTNPADPKAIAFIDIPGNLDIAVRGGILYADMYRDLVVVDISDPQQARFIREVPNVFPDRYYPGMVNDTAYMIVDWNRKDTMIDVDDIPTLYYPQAYLASAADMASGNSKGNYVPGIAGSMARFSLVNNYLYTINSNSLTSLDISTPDNPVRRSDTFVGWSIETLYPFGNNLFIGSSTGMFIYDIADPANPKPTGTFTHARACDPVITDGQFALVTLRTGTMCGGTVNQLDIVDVSDVQSPRLFKSYIMTNPAGLAKDGDALFICDGTDGLKVYDASNLQNIKLLRHLSGVEAYDVIAWNNILLMSATEGIYQYDYSDLAGMKLLSRISVNK